MINGPAAAADTIGVVTDATPVDAGAAIAPDRSSHDHRPTWVLVAVGSFTLAVLTLAVVAWIDLHADAWRGAVTCSASFDAPRTVRMLVSLCAAAGFAGLAVSGVWLGVHPAHPRASRTFWLATGVACLAVLGVVVFGGTAIDHCLRAL
jgi:hypothetical protein